jgi:hypothetical protein
MNPSMQIDVEIVRLGRLELLAVVTTSERAFSGTLLVGKAIDVVAGEVSARGAVLTGAGILGHATLVAGLCTLSLSVSSSAVSGWLSWALLSWLGRAGDARALLNDNIKAGGITIGPLVQEIVKGVGPGPNLEKS